MKTSRPFARCGMHRLLGAWAALASAMLVACGGGGGSDDASACSDTTIKAFVRDTTFDQYLFPDLLPDSVDLDDYADAQALLDAMTAEARSLGYDRGFSYVTTITADQARFQGQNAGFGFRIALTQNDELLLPEVFETAPAGAAFVRGTQILEIDAGDGYQPVSTWIRSDGSIDEEAFGPSDVGVERGFRYLLPGSDVIQQTRLTKAEYELDPVSDDYGAALLPQAGTAGVGYLNLRSFVTTADDDLRAAYDDFRALGVNDFIIDLRYNGGGLVSIAELYLDLIGRPFVGQPAYALERADGIADRYAFGSEPQAVSPVRIAFITTGASASASELVINSMDPYLPIAIVGSDTYGKPVGQSAFDYDACDVRLRLVTFRTINADGEADYYDGLASTLNTACEAADDLAAPMGDPTEESTAAALDWLASGSCPHGSLATGAQAKRNASPPLRMLRPGPPSAARELFPGAV